MANPSSYNQINSTQSLRVDSIHKQSMGSDSLNHYGKRQCLRASSNVYNLATVETYKVIKDLLAKKRKLLIINPRERWVRICCTATKLKSD